jgi:hypothetical protein
LSPQLSHVGGCQGLFEEIALWNGFGRALFAWTCGTNTQTEALALQPERAVSLMMRAEELGTSPKLFARTPDQLDIRDLYTFDCIIAMTPQDMEAVLRIFENDLGADWDSQEDRDHYRQRVCQLGDFSAYANIEQLLSRGGKSLLPRRLSALIQGDVQALQGRAEIATVSLQEVDAWNDMVCAIVVAAAGAAQYLMGTYPPDLRQMWLE